MRVGNFKSLTEMAQKSNHNADFVAKLKSASSEIFDRSMDKLLIDKATGSDEKLATLEDLKDLRNAVLVGIKKPEAAREANLLAAIKSAPSKSEIADGIPESGKGAEEGTTIKREIEGTFLYGPNNGRELSDGGGLYSKAKFEAENFDPMTGSKNFLKGLTYVIGLASAVAALPPGPMAISVGTMAKEEASSSFGSQSSGASVSQGGSAILLGLGGISSHSSAATHQSSASGNSAYRRESTDERLATAIQELDFHMEQAETRPSNTSKIQTKYKETTYKEEKVPKFFGLSSKTVNKKVGRDWLHKTHSTADLEPDRLWLPETGLSEFN